MFLDSQFKTSERLIMTYVPCFLRISTPLLMSYIGYFLFVCIFVISKGCLPFSHQNNSILRVD